MLRFGERTLVGDSSPLSNWRARRSLLLQISTTQSARGKHKVREPSEPANPLTPGAEYGLRLQRQSIRTARLMRFHRLVVLLRRLFFGAVVILAVLTEREFMLAKIVI